MDELTMLREQMTSMKHSLNQSRIVNKTLMNKVMKKSSSWLNNTVWIEAVSTPVLALLFLAVSMGYGVSIWFAISFLVISWIDTAFDYKTLRIPSKWFSELDVITLRKRLLHQKTLRKKQYLISLPLAVIWGVWFGYEILIKSVKDMPLDFTAYAAFFVVISMAVVAGVCTSLVIYRRAQHTNDALLGQIKEYEEMTPDDESE